MGLGRSPFSPLDPWYASDDRKWIDADRQSNGRDVHRRERGIAEWWEEEDELEPIDYDAIARKYRGKPCGE